MARVDIIGHRTLAMLYDLSCPVEMATVYTGNRECMPHVVYNGRLVGVWSLAAGNNNALFLILTLIHFCLFGVVSS